MYTLPHKSKMIKTWCLLAREKSTSSPISFLRYHKDIANFSNHLAETLMLINMEKIKFFLTHFFLEIMQSYAQGIDFIPHLFPDLLQRVC